MNISPGFDRRFVETPFRQSAAGIACRAFGPETDGGEPLVLMHGGAGSWDHWVRNVDVLGTAYRVLALDLPSYGDSDRVEWDISIDDYLRVTADAVAELCGDAPRIHLAGFSFGGAVAAAVAVTLGPRTGSLSMTGGAGYGSPAGRRSFTLESHRRLAERLGRAPSEQELRDMHAQNLAKLMIWDPAKIDDWAIDMQFRNVRRTRFDSRRISWAGDTPALIGQLACPVAVIYGEHDSSAIPPIPDRIEMCRATRPDVEVHIIPDCGHWAMYEAPEVLNALLLDFHGRARAV